MSDEEVRKWKKLHPGKASQPGWLRSYIENKTIDGFDTKAEKMWAILNETNIRPTCPVCGGKLKMSGAKWNTTCSVKCGAKLPNRINKIKQTNLQRYGVTSSLHTPSAIEKTKETNLKKYGIDHASKSIEIIDKISNTNILRYGNKCTLNSAKNIELKKATWLENYGVDNPSKASSIKEKTIKANNLNCKKAKAERLIELENNHNIKPLFVDWQNSNIEYAWKHLTCNTNFNYHFIGNVIPRCPKCFPKNVSAEEQKLQDFLYEINVDFISNDRKLLNGREIDIFIPSANLGIEVNGVYWHHDSSTTLSLLEKTKLAEKNNISLIHFWDFEINSKFDIVKNIILAKLKLHKKVYARKLKVVEIKSKEAAEFLNHHHLAGFAKAKIYLALKQDNEIFAVASFAANRFKKDGTWELVRFASKGVVVGGLSKLISNFKNIVDAPLVSFADARISTGEAYKAIGFKYDSLSKPNYFYARGSRRLHRQQAMKHKLSSFLEKFDNSLSEYQNMSNNGWLRCFDCGSYKFTLT